MNTEKVNPKLGDFCWYIQRVPENHLVVQICLHLICIDLPLPRELRVGFPDVLCDCDLLPAPVRGGLSSPLSHSLQDLSTSRSHLNTSLPLTVSWRPLCLLQLAVYPSNCKDTIPLSVIGQQVPTMYTGKSVTVNRHSICNRIASHRPVSVICRQV